MNPDAEVGEQVGVGIVLDLGGGEVDRAAEGMGRVVERGAEGGIRPVDEDRSERRGHGLGAPPRGARIGHRSDPLVT